ncbi:MAG: hypothetical protein H3C35_03670 [Bacteroidetes bacterium]|nr:hypothetical protein [Bacteroidota bacterium]
MQTSTEKPTTFRTGETVKWQEADYADFPQSDGWQPKYTISGAEGSKELVGAFADGSWTYTLTAANNDLPVGDYVLYGVAEKGTGASKEVYPLNATATSLTVMLGLATAIETEIRTHPQKAIALIEELIESFLTDGIQSATILGRTYTRENLNDLYLLRNRYKRQVNGSPMKTIPVEW